MIAATGSFLPETEVHNDELRERFAHLPGFVNTMEETSGIRRRFYAPEDWATSDLALPAARQALDRAGIRPEQVDLIILGTDSPDYITPATSVVLQHKLGAINAGTFDIGCACASFPTALATGAGWIATNPSIRTVLVVGVYLMHKLADKNDPTLFFYGDGAGAVVLVASDHPGFIGAAAQADGAYHKHWGIYSGGTYEPASVASVEAGRTQVRFIERYPPDVNHTGWPRLVRKLAAGCGFQVADIDFILFTQVRKASIELVMADLGLPMERTHTIMEKWGYTGSACLPMALDDAQANHKIHPGDRLVLVGSGVGYNQAAVAFTMP
ncbi:MAG: ketoacyl-ACP synthase III [Holophaga sp.]|nr:ketoacyl-ACP synthase III [Holophaga sp.]